MLLLSVSLPNILTLLLFNCPSHQLTLPFITTLPFAQQTPTHSRRKAHRFLKTHSGISGWNLGATEEKGHVKVDQLYGLQIRYQECLYN